MQAADLPAVLRIQHRCYQPDFHEPMTAFESKLAQAPHACWVLCGPSQMPQAYLVSLPVQTGDYPVLHATDWQLPRHADALYLHDMAVLPELRGMRAATQLLQQAKHLAHTQRWQRIDLIAVQDSSAFWHAQGFQTQSITSLAIIEKLRTFGPGAQLMAHHLSEP